VHIFYYNFPNTKPKIQKFLLEIDNIIGDILQIFINFIIFWIV